MRTLLLSLSLALLLIGCGADEGPLPTGADFPTGQGGMAIDLEMNDPISSDLTGWIRIYKEPTDLQTPVTEREFRPERSTRTYDLFYLEAGDYAVLAELVDTDGLVVMSGLLEGVTVIPGYLTPVALQLVPSGGIHVEVEVRLGGERFEIDPQIWSFLGQPMDTFAGTQRVEDVSDEGDDPSYEVRYYGIGGGWPGFYLFSGASPDELLDEPMTPVSGLSSSCKFYGASAAGDHLYLAARRGSSRILIYRSLDGLEWSQFASLDVERQLGDVLHHCLLFIDNQFNLICAATDEYESPFGAGLGHSFGLVHAYSPDGERWTELLPYRSGLFDGMVMFSKILGNFQPDIEAFDGFSSGVMGVVYVGGVYMAWLNARRREPGWTSYLYRLTSTDRRSWTSPRVLDWDATNTVFGESISGVLYSAAMYQTLDGFVMIFPENKSLRIAREVE